MTKSKSVKLLGNSASTIDVLLKRRGSSAFEKFPTNDDMREELEKFKSSKLEIEAELEKSIICVFEEIVYRKYESARRNVAKKDVKAIDEPALKSLSRAAAGITGLGLVHFSEQDRLSAIAEFVARSKIFPRLVRAISAELDL
jgi:hypothetical protein